MENNKLQKLELVYQKIERAYKDLRNEWLRLPVDFLIDKHYAYEIAHQQEIHYFFETIYENAEDYIEDTICDEDILDTILKVDVNWIYQIYEYWLHVDSEYCNFFLWGDLETLIIQCVLRFKKLAEE